MHVRTAVRRPISSDEFEDAGVGAGGRDRRGGVGDSDLMCQQRGPDMPTAEVAADQEARDAGYVHALGTRVTGLAVGQAVGGWPGRGSGEGLDG